MTVWLMTQHQGLFTLNNPQLHLPLFVHYQRHHQESRKMVWRKRKFFQSAYKNVCKGAVKEQAERRLKCRSTSRKLKTSVDSKNEASGNRKCKCSSGTNNSRGKLVKSSLKKSYQSVLDDDSEQEPEYYCIICTEPFSNSQKHEKWHKLSKVGSLSMHRRLGIIHMSSLWLWFWLGSDELRLWLMSWRRLIGWCLPNEYSEFSRRQCRYVIYI